MGNQRKRYDSRKKFNRAAGKYAHSVKIKNTKAIYRQERKILQYCKDKIKVPPYQIVTRQVLQRGQYCTKFLVRRIPIYKDRTTKTLRITGTSLLFKRQTCENLTGNRIINLENLKEHVVDITIHTAVCNKAQVLAARGECCLKLETENNRNGLYSVLSAVCQGCKKKFQLHTSKFNTSNNIADVNLRAVWGTISTGGGCSGLQELFGTLDMPSMNKTMFSRIEDNIGKWWEGVFKEEIVKAGLEERRLAIERGDFHNGVPAITVICDGGWSKRSHKHTYNANGGVAVIFGAVTKKLLYLGVRNKYCYICNQGNSEKQHTCYKNWDESSQSMESNMILEGFLEAESVHGLRYMKVIADGDSSVYNKIVENVPVWGPHVEKMECANHACKCLRANLEKLVEEKPEYKGKGKLTKHIRVRLTTAVRCAIRMHSAKKNNKQLKKDIRNSVYHVFGLHENCSNFCQKRVSGNTVVTEGVKDIDDNDNDDLFDDLSEFWHIASDSELKESRFACQKTTEDVKNIIKDVSVFLNRLAEKSHRLVGNFTTNLAESWMNIRCKFDGGKMFNRCNRGSWQTRCIGGALRKNFGPSWSPIVYQKATNDIPGHFFLNTFRQKSKHLLTSLKTQQGEKAKLKRRKRKQISTAQPTKKAKLDYGPSVLNDTKDVTSKQLQTLMNQFHDKVVERSADDIKKIEEDTREQSICEKWKRERKIRLTSSNFGKIFKRNVNNKSTAIVKTLLYSNFKGTMYTIRGLAQEANTLIEYKNIQSHVNEVKKQGLMICHSYPFLAASTDGMVYQDDGDIGLLEIKNLLQTNKLSLKEASKTLANFCLKINNDGKLQLKTNHDYYFQCQGQLNIYQLPWLDFVVRRTNPYEIHIERIFRDSQLWEKMLPKLEQFYMKFLLPELALPRYGTVTGIRQPHCPWFETHDLQKNKTKRLSSDQNNNLVIQDKVILPQTPATIISTSQKVCAPVAKTTYDISVQPGPHLRQTAIQSSSDTVNACSSKEYTCTLTNEKCGRQRRRVLTKFVGRTISHEWCVDESSKQKKWFKGTVLDVKKGRDGSPNAVYEVLYEGEDSPCEIENLNEEFKNGSVIFIDL